MAPNAKRYTSERWWRILDVFEELCGKDNECQLPIGELVERTGVPLRTLYRFLRDMQDLGVLDVRSTRDNFDNGRLPSVYTLNIRGDEWRDKWEMYVLAYDVGYDDTPIRRIRRPIEHDAPVQPDAAFSPDSDEIAETIREHLARLDAEGDVEIDAWLAGVD